MKHNFESISVIIPAHNAASYIEKAISSVKAQTVPGLEIVVGNDGSTDDTSRIAREAGATVLDLPKANGNVARNAAARAAKGDLLFFLDADDWWKEDKVEAHLRAWSEQDCSVVLDRSLAIWPSGDPVGWMGGNPNGGLMAWQAFLNHRTWTSGSSFSVPRQNFESIGGFREDVTSFQDVDFWVRLVQACGPAYGLKESYTYYLQAPGSVSKTPKRVEENLKVVLQGWPFATEHEKRRFRTLVRVGAASRTPFPASLAIFYRCLGFAGNRFYWRCVLTSLQHTFSKR